MPLPFLPENLPATSKFSEKENTIIAGNRLLSIDYNTYKEYYKFILDNSKSNFKNKGRTDQIVLPIDIDHISINYDVKDNSYWLITFQAGTMGIAIYDKFGNVIDAFYILKHAIYEVPPNGDIYILKV